MIDERRTGARATPYPAGEEVPRAEVLSPRGFWIGFAAAWSAYGLLTGVTIGIEGQSPPMAAAGALLVLAPCVLPAAVLAHRRHHLLRPMRTRLRFFLHKILVGVGYAASAVSLGAVCYAIAPVRPMRALSESLAVAVSAWFLSALFLYVIFLFALLWLDALERMYGARALVAEEAVLRARAEAKALRAQFNPHFVFNTLHSLMLLVRREPDTAERAIEDVAELIRYASTLQRHEVDQVTLGKELAFARHYLALEKLRLADRLAVVWDVDDALADVLVPAFSLQTLLENAINHGIAPKPEGGTVRVSAALDGRSLTMSVEDDGMGADPRAIEAEGGSGLELLRRRIAAVHGEAATLEWSTRRGDGFSARLTVPADRVRAPSDGREPVRAGRVAGLGSDAAGLASEPSARGASE